MESVDTNLPDLLEERFVGPQGAEARAKVLAELSKLEMRLVLKLGSLLSKSDFAMLSAALKATQSAQSVVRVWAPPAK